MPSSVILALMLNLFTAPFLHAAEVNRDATLKLSAQNIVSQELKAANQDQLKRSTNEFRGPAPVRWSEWHPLPAPLARVIARTSDYSFRVSSHYQAEFRLETNREKIMASALIPDPTLLKGDAELCWFTVLSGGARCFSYRELPALLPSERELRQSDLLTWSRKLSTQYGLRLSRELLRLALPTQSQSGSQLEARFNRVVENLDGPRAYADSWQSMSRSARARTGIFLLYGQSQDKKKSPAVQAMDGMAARFNAEGFRAYMIDTKQGAATWDNALRVKTFIEGHAHEFDRIVLMPISKGSHEVAIFVLDYRTQMKPSDAQKIKLVISLSGVIRYTYVSRWVMMSPPAGPTRQGVKAAFLLFPGENSSNMRGGSIRSLATDPWVAKNSLSSANKNLKWVNFAMLPENADGTQSYSLSKIIFPWILNANPAIGPQDGATETASSILPPHTGFEQHIIRVYGPHTLVPGRTMDGALISPRFHDKNLPNHAALGGEDLVNEILRSFPTKLLK